MTGDTPASVEAAFGGRLTPLVHDRPHRNTHYRGVTADGTRVFVKVIDGNPAYYTAEVRAQRHLLDGGVPVPRLLDHGAVGERRWWLAYEWRDFDAFVPVRDLVERAGHLLGRLHAATNGIQDDALRRYADVHRLIAEKTARIAEFDAPLARRVQRLHERIAARGGNREGNGGSVCLLHGDMGWRNLHTDPAGRLWLLDFEHAAIGHPLLDFAKLWDRELDAPADREVFLRGYQRSWPAAEPVRLDAIDTVRLWAAAGIFPYARPREDHDFERHASSVLDRLEAGR
ncbi:aminoglycoside phosphotransferase family protein [Streptomyces sp. NBC_01476]|uniref:phosphotransferase enzyme family protein n=1 Tax=Streptomyces sp. NBC_01476 TaxID=2903881 RepID=UPI002E31CCB8|nr:aminoglycoside phosphotransferase family protein [Streptomyces sp. NBC_01476]